MRIYIILSAFCLILMIYLFSQNNKIFDKLNELESRINKLQSQKISKPLGDKLDQAHTKDNHRIENEPKPISTDSGPAKTQIEQMVREAVRSYQEKEAHEKRSQRIYNSIKFLANMLELSEQQKDGFWLIMTEFYDEYNRISDGFKGLDKTSRDSYEYQMSQLKERVLQRLKSILTAEQMEGLEIRLGIP